MKRLRRLMALGLSLCMLVPLSLRASAASMPFRDVPADSFAYDDILSLAERGIVQGIGDGLYGTYEPFKRCDFVLMLARLMGWQTDGQTPQATDVPQGHYAAGAIASAENAGIVGSPDQGYQFRPNDSITRAEMATMLVKALGVSWEARSQFASVITKEPFTDVTRAQYPSSYDYIMMAYDFGIIQGQTAGTPTAFNPTGNATREETAAMMMRFYRVHTSQLTDLHGFYAISSYSQKDLIPALSEMTAGWSRLEFSEQNGPWLNTTGQNENDWAVPTGSEEITALAQQNQVPLLLGVFLNTAQQSGGQVQAELLLSDAYRARSVAAITDFLAQNPAYNGVTIDFEGFVSSSYQEPFTAFLTELCTALDSMGSYQLYCAVPPAKYYQGYDYRAIGQVADKVILMAHDYAPNTLSTLSADTIPETPLAPYAEVYLALQQITDPETGVQDKSKVLLALSFGTVRWEYTAEHINTTAKTSDYTAIYNRLTNGSSEYYYNEASQSPYLYYYDDSDGTTNVVWYENSDSIQAKCDLARYFGIGGVSLWRLGLVPNYSDQHLDVWQTIANYF